MQKRQWHFYWTMGKVCVQRRPCSKREQGPFKGLREDSVTGPKHIPFHRTQEFWAREESREVCVVWVRLQHGRKVFLKTLEQTQKESGGFARSK